MKFAPMKFFRRSKKSTSDSRSKSSKTSHQAYDDVERDKYRLYNPRPEQHYNHAAERGRIFAPWLELPAPILERVFAFVCPHSSDESYETCERSAVEDACMLCDLRDLAHAGQVCKLWRRSAIRLMYAPSSPLPSPLLFSSCLMFLPLLSRLRFLSCLHSANHGPPHLGTVASA
ncbi:hypothetical protein F4803DRAFT_155471 [Xylaria telfairii]|nr:hypothetical protein F4803DRAFT_155471 [Xylaria telfairii]